MRPELSWCGLSGDEEPLNRSALTQFRDQNSPVFIGQSETSTKKISQDMFFPETVAVSAG